MNKSNRINYIKIGLLILLATLIIGGGKVLGQLSAPATEPGGEFVEMAPSYISGDPAYQNVTPPDDNPATEGYSPAINYTYYLVAGATLRGRSSTAQYVYDGAGCSQTTAGVDKGRILNTELNIPDHAVIKYLRVYYNDANPNSGVEGFITKYQPTVEGRDLINTGSSDAFIGGYGFSVSQQITETVDNSTFAYTLIGWPDENNVANQICGLRVAYYAPFHGTIFMPVVHR
jgi:hypothetical protein